MQNSKVPHDQQVLMTLWNDLKMIMFSLGMFLNQKMLLIQVGLSRISGSGRVKNQMRTLRSPKKEQLQSNKI